MIIYLNRAAAIQIQQTPLSQLRRLALALRRRVSGHSGGAALVDRNLRRELALQSNFFWAAAEGGKPVDSALDVAWVIRSLHDLKFAIQLKRDKKIRSLWAGPNIVVVPQEAAGLLSAPEIDACIVPCQWAAAFYAREAPGLKEKLTVWPVGLDTAYWQDTFQRPKKGFLIYNKNQSELAGTLERQMKAQGLETRVITYGHYVVQDYRSALSESRGMIFLSRSETQGLACLEALSMNVPVLAWDPGAMHYVSQKLKRTFTCESSSVPYFDPRCGERFKTMDDFPHALARFLAAAYQPREWLLSQQLDLATNLQRLSLLKTV